MELLLARRADVGNDHHLLVANPKLKLRKAKIGQKRNQHLDMVKLRDPAIKKAFGIALKNNSMPLNETAITIDTFSKATIEAPKETIGYMTSPKTKRISAHTWNMIKERKELKKKVLIMKCPELKERTAAQYRMLDKWIKSSSRIDSRQYMEQLAAEAKAAAGQKDMRTTYQIMRNLLGE